MTGCSTDGEGSSNFPIRTRYGRTWPNVKNKRLACLDVSGSVPVPNIAVHKAGFDGPAVRLQRVQQRWHADLQNQVSDGAKFGLPWQALCVEVEHVRQFFVVAGLPGVLPQVRQLVEFGMAGRGVEAEFARGRERSAVQLGKAEGQPFGIQGLLSNDTEFGQQEIVWLLVVFVYAPGELLCVEGREDLVNGFIGLKLPFAHHSVVLACRDLCWSMSFGGGVKWCW